MREEAPPAGVLDEAIPIAFEKLEQYGIIDVDHNYESAGEEEPAYTTSEKFNGHFLEGLADVLKKGRLFNEDRYYELIIMSLLKAAGGGVDMGSEPVMAAAIEIVRGALDDDTAPDHERGYGREKALSLIRKMDATGKYAEEAKVKETKRTVLEDF
jgi:hypothetical protein